MGVRDWKQREFEYVPYHTRAMRKDLKDELKLIALQEGKSVEELLNDVIEFWIKMRQGGGYVNV